MAVTVAGSMFISLAFSLGFGQTANLNVLAVPTPAAVADVASASSPICGVITSFFDSQGNQLNNNEVWINPGATTTLSQSPGRRAFAGNGLFYAEVSLDSNSDLNCQLLPSLDVTNFDGSTAVLVPFSRGLESALF